MPPAIQLLIERGADIKARVESGGAWKRTGARKIERSQKAGRGAGRGAGCRTGIAADLGDLSALPWRREWQRQRRQARARREVGARAEQVRRGSAQAGAGAGRGCYGSNADAARSDR